MISVICGDNIYACELALNKLTDKETTPVDMTEPEAVRRLAELASGQSLFGNTNTVVVRYLDQSAEARASVIEILKNIPKDNHVIVYLGGLKKANALVKPFIKLADQQIVEETLSTSQLTSWLKKSVEERGGKTDTSTAEFLVDWAGDSQLALTNEIDKLIALDKNISVESIKQVVPASPQTTVFQMLDAMAEGRGDSALEYYQQLLAVQLDPHYIMSMVCWQAHAMTIAVVGRKHSQQEILKATGISPYVLAKAAQTTRRMDRGAIVRLNEEILSTDYQIKTAMVDASAAVEQLIRKVAFSAATA